MDSVILEMDYAITTSCLCCEYIMVITVSVNK